ncbi:MAG: citrate (Si)-synthase [Gemmatimonadetes bacterium]|nr:MAG: citrate (Si)-synthase [Gemmatimonadota bacterium]
MANLKETLQQKIPVWRDEIRSIVKEHGSTVISEVTIQQAYGGMRGVKGLVCDTSLVKPDAGLIIRGIPVLELTERLPEEIFFLLCTGELPDEAALKDLQTELKRRAEVPQYVWDMLETLPADSHPMMMFNMAVLSLEKQSVFRQKYDEGMSKTDYWEPTLEDALNLLAKIPALVTGIYRLRFNKGDRIAPNPDLDWAGNMAHMFGIDDPEGHFADLMRLYMVLHTDHEGGNVSAFSCHVIGSALSDAYYAVSGGLNGLAGPLHGLANQEVLRWIINLRKQYNGVPTAEEIVKFAWDTLNSGKVIPGYGHAVLRVTDPRYTAFHNFGKKVCPEAEMFQIVDVIFQNIPKVLQEHGKAKNPWPNVDAISGSLLYHFGLTEMIFYTVLFSASRAMGMLSQLLMSRAMGEPITRPKSVGTQWIKDFLAGQS